MKKQLHYPEHSIYGNCPYILLMFIVNLDKYYTDIKLTLPYYNCGKSSKLLFKQTTKLTSFVRKVRSSMSFFAVEVKGPTVEGPVGEK